MDFFLTKTPRITKCCIKNCKSLELDPNLISHFTFPNDPSRCAVWIDKCGLPRLKTIAVLNKKYKLCSLHFESSMFRNKQKNRLKFDAVPTLFENLPQQQTFENHVSNDHENVDNNLPSCLTSDTSSNTISMSDVLTSPSIEISTAQSQIPLSLSNQIPQKNKLKEKLSTEKKRKKELESSISSNSHLCANNSIEIALEVCEKYCSPTVFMLVKSQLQNKQRKSHGSRYSNDIKQLALNIHLVSPKLYQMMQKPLSLPVSRTLRRGTCKYEINHNLNNSN